MLVYREGLAPQRAHVSLHGFVTDRVQTTPLGLERHQYATPKQPVPPLRRDITGSNEKAPLFLVSVQSDLGGSLAQDSTDDAGRKESTSAHGSNGSAAQAVRCVPV